MATGSPDMMAGMAAVALAAVTLGTLLAAAMAALLAIVRAFANLDGPVRPRPAPASLDWPPPTWPGMNSPLEPDDPDDWHT